MLQLNFESLDHDVKRRIHGIECDGIKRKLGWRWSDLHTRTTAPIGGAHRDAVCGFQAAQEGSIVVRPPSYTFDIVVRCSFESSVHVHVRSWYFALPFSAGRPLCDSVMAFT